MQVSGKYRKTRFFPYMLLLRHNICRKLIGEKVGSSPCLFLQAALISEQIDIFFVRYKFTEKGMQHLFFFLLESIVTANQYEDGIIYVYLYKHKGR